jgi:hypothetical protein
LLTSGPSNATSPAAATLALAITSVEAQAINTNSLLFAAHATCAIAAVRSWSGDRLAFSP